MQRLSDYRRHGTQVAICRRQGSPGTERDAENGQQLGTSGQSADRKLFFAIACLDGQRTGCAITHSIAPDRRNTFCYLANTRQRAEHRHQFRAPLCSPGTYPLRIP